jgi:serine/threonine-protein kinase
MIGSPMYMAPEQARNAKDVDERADVWSLAIVTWEALAGARLWGQQTSLAELIVAICTDPLRRLEEAAPWIPEDLARVVHKGLERDLTQRTPSMHAFITGLELFAGGSDRVTADQLVGLTPEHRAVLAQRTRSVSGSRSAATAPGTRGHVSRHPTPSMASVGKWQAPAPPKESTLWLWALAGVLVLAASIGAWLFLR